MVKDVRIPTASDVGVILVHTLEELDVAGEYNVAGGGLRHGDVSWEIVYEASQLIRYIFLTAHDDVSANEVVVHAQVAATDGNGHWRYIARGSPRCASMADLHEFMINVLSDGIVKANSIQADDLSGVTQA